MLTINGYGEGTCVWCLTKGEGVEADFKDGLTGFLCRKHFWEALKSRSEQIDSKQKETSHAESQPGRKAP